MIVNNTCVNERKLYNKAMTDKYVIYANIGDDNRLSSYHVVKHGKYLFSREEDEKIKADIIINTKDCLG